MDGGSVHVGADVLMTDESGIKQFRYPSYVQHIMGDIFSLGFGPFRYYSLTQLTKLIYLSFYGFN